MSVTVGLVMLQGARHEHANALLHAANQLEIKINLIELRSSEDVIKHEIDALVLPGGESTTIRKTSEKNGLFSSK